MGNVAIKIENLSKAYQLGKIGTGTISRDLERFFVTKILGKEDPFLKIGQTNDRTIKGTSDIVWSLRDIDFSVNQGEAIGIIGKNGAGKSTLLKILSRVTSPTIGSVNIKGRVSSLLEVGTGFHPELSGRENIYLNGAILGMRKAEITRKFDEIVDFSGVERYIDTPVKRYSSGMYVRLAFAVAAHLESEILVIDEVLAVGDAEFQKKCLGKMGDISKGEGRTILFVSHNTEAVANLCQRVILLDKGKVDFDGTTQDGLFKYINKETKNENPVVFVDNNKLDRSGHKKHVNLLSIRLLNENLTTQKFFKNDQINIVLEFEVLSKTDNIEIGVVISNYKGQRLHHLVSSWDTNFGEMFPGKYKVSILTDPIALYPSEYNISTWARKISEETSDDFVEDAIRFDVVKNENQLFKQVNAFSRNGGVYLDCKWSIKSV